MKKVIFTTFLSAFLGVGVIIYAQSPEGSTGWETLMPGEPLVLEDDFRDFPHFHSQLNTDDSNSRNTETTFGLKDTTASRVCIASIDTIKYEFYQCAFAPNWQTAYGYTDSVENNPSQATPGVQEDSWKSAGNMNLITQLMVTLLLTCVSWIL